MRTIVLSRSRIVRRLSLVLAAGAAGALLGIALPPASAQSGSGCVECLTGNCDGICGSCTLPQTCACNTRGKCIID